ncbi:phosphoribosyl transferase [Candidatus Kaiserbacteria bacterium]|nr:phosphoribosyl transferase [Candidatus Kaiserbacteria bacterium]
MTFYDRSEAGRLLAKKLGAYRRADAVVLALPRGGVVLGYEVAQDLDLPLDIIAVRKIGHPNNPEFAVCAVDEHGTLLCDEAGRASLDPDWLRQEVMREQKESQRRNKVYRQGKKPLSITGKTAIIVDDGVATGLTMRLAIMAVRSQKPKRIVVAVPVAPFEPVEQISEQADESVVLTPPEDFLGAVGTHYERFAQVSDDEVIRLLS